MNIKNLKGYDVKIGNIFRVKNSLHLFTLFCRYQSDDIFIANLTTGELFNDIWDLGHKGGYEFYKEPNPNKEDDFYGVDVIEDDIMKCLFF